MINNFIKSVSKIKKIIYINLVFTLLGLLLGYFLARSGYSEQLRETALSGIGQSDAIGYVMQLILEKKIGYAMGYTFLFNLFSGALLTTTLAGIIFVIPSYVMFTRGILLGLLTIGSSENIFYLILLLGTIFLEFGAYIFSSSVGSYLGLSLIAYKNLGYNNIGQAIKGAFKIGLDIYPIVVFLLILGAIWEIGGIYLLTK